VIAPADAVTLADYNLVYTWVQRHKALLFHRRKSGFLPRSPEECLELQARSKVCLNIFRDEHCPKTGKNSELALPAYSMNPRCYDVFMCGSMLLTNYRKEVVEMFGEDCLYGENPEKKIVEAIKKFDQWKDIADKYRKTVVEGNLYIHRAMSLLSCIGQGFFM